MTRCSRFLRLSAMLATAVLLSTSACGDDAAPAGAAPHTTTAPPSATADGSPEPAATAIESASAEADAEAPLPLLDEPNAERAFADLRVLAVEIGPRAAGTPEERRAAEYVAEELERAGYAVALEPFEATFSSDASRVAVDGGGEFGALALGGTPNGEAHAPLVFAGLGAAGELASVPAAGAVVVVDRGTLTFAEKARNAAEAGAVALVVVNTEAGLFQGSVGEGGGIAIPVVAAPLEQRTALLGAAAAGGVATVRADAGRRTAVSQNVVARPSDAPCEAYLGAHYDSVPQGPGANDNASGTALLIELARTHRVDGLCVVAFGAEEVGLVGSRAFVAAHDVEDARFMLNFDMVARIGGPRMIAGDAQLAETASRLAADLGYTIPVGRFPANASSDHASFSAAGVPAITVHSGGGDFIHTAQDAIATVSVDDLAVFVEVSAALLRALLDGTAR